jgi:hypothetical protein
LDGACFDNLWASYVHLHFAARLELAQRLVAAAGDWAREHAVSVVTGECP